MRKSVIDEVVNVSKEIMNNSKNENVEQIIEPLVNNVSKNMENKFQILQNQIILPLTNKINESESRMNSKLDNITSTPSLVINGELIDYTSFADLKTKIDGILN